LIRISPAGIHFESPKGNVALQLEGLKISLGGANDRLIFFTHPLQPDATIHTPDHSVLQHPVLAQHPELIHQIGGVRKQKHVARAVTLSILGAIVVGLLALVACKDLLVKAVANSVPVEWEIKLGDKLFGQIAGAKHFITDTNIEAQLAEITAPLVGAIEDADYPLKFHIVEDSSLNAFAIPGGHVVIHSGLLLAADTPEEVAGVLAHEISHVTQRHGFRSIVSSAGLYMIVQFFFGDVSSLLAVIANNSAFLLDRKFSRDFEREADETGWDYLLRANIEPQGMIGFFRKMELEERKIMDHVPDAAEGAVNVVSTHPATAERIQRLEARWRELEKKTGYREFELNYREFKDSLRARLHSAAPTQKGN
jgi:predicted Zn-dependent protease